MYLINKYFFLYTRLFLSNHELYQNTFSGDSLLIVQKKNIAMFIRIKLSCSKIFFFNNFKIPF